MARRIFALTGWPTLIILPMVGNWGLVQYRLGLGATLILTLGLHSLLIFAVEQLMPRKSDWLENDGQPVKRRFLHRDNGHSVGPCSYIMRTV